MENKQDEGKNMEDYSLNFIIRVPYNKHIASITNVITKKCDHPFLLVSIADEIETGKKFENVNLEIHDRKKKNEDLKKKYEEEFDAWEIKKRIALMGIDENTTVYREEMFKFMQNNPEPVKPILVNEKIQNKNIVKKARMFTINFKFWTNYKILDRSDFDKAHKEIAKFMLQLLFEIEKRAIKSISFSIIGDKIDCEDRDELHSKIESLGRLKKKIDDFENNKQKSEWTLKDVAEENKQLKEEIKELEKKIKAILDDEMESDKKNTLYRKFINLGMDKEDVEKALIKMRKCLEIEGMTEDSMNEMIDQTRRRINKS